MELILVFLFHFALLPCTWCNDAVPADKSDITEKIKLIKVMRHDSDLKEDILVPEKSFSDEPVPEQRDIRFESVRSELPGSDEVIFSVLAPNKEKDELLSLENNIMQEMQDLDMDMLNISTTNTSVTPAAPPPPPPESNKTVTVECMLRAFPDDEIPSVILANSSVLQNILVPVNGTNITVAECAVVLFYSSQCVFSARMAPHYNALARVFPGIGFYALDTSLHNGIHVRYGIVSVPNVLLFHNAKPVARFNDSHVNLENLALFVTKYTTLHHNGTLNVTSADMTGPVPATLTKKIDYALILAWCFTIFCACFWFLKSSLCNRIVECIRNTWNEAEAQHEHTD